jgi:uncharacterized protein YkwD
MKNQSLYFSILFFFLSFSFSDLMSQTQGMDTTEAKEMFSYLQKLRQKEVDKSDPLLKYVGKNSPLLFWNDTLVKVAEARVLDLVKYNYFDHVDKKGRGVNYYIANAGYYLEPEWTENKKDNFFESLQAGAEDANAVIYDLVIDNGVPSKGHRKHLLGLDDWNVKNVDVGIAYYRKADGDRCDYITYTVIIIARHHW